MRPTGAATSIMTPAGHRGRAARCGGAYFAGLGRPASGGLGGAVGVVQAQELAVRTESAVGLFPERAGLPQPAGLGVPDGRDGQADEAGELRLGEAGGVAVAGE